MPTRELSDWTVTWRDWDPADQPLREALTTLGNGLFATRGAAEEARAGGAHYPGTYVAGGYDRLESEVAGRLIENEDLVNWPNWLPLSFRIEGGEWFDLEAARIEAFEQRLDLRSGVLSRSVEFRDRDDRRSRLESRRIVSMADPHTAAIDWVLTPLDWSGRIEIRSEIDGRVTNDGVARYRELDGRHLEVTDGGRTDEEGMDLVARSVQSRRVVAIAARTRVFEDGVPAAAERRTEAEPDRIAQLLTVEAGRRRPIRVEKIVSLHTSMDRAISEPRLASATAIRRLPGFEALLEGHRLAWRHLWHRCDLRIETPDRDPQTVLRLHVFHLLQTASEHSIDRDAGVPARGLHGEAYRGHVFWDEVFIFPFLNLRIPEITRALLLYRYRRLPEARHAAREAGFEGAMFPWQSGSDGREESQVVHLNPESGEWIPDDTHRQRHVSADIAWNVHQYHEATGDEEFMASYGIELLLEIARFWASIAELSPEKGRWEIRGVVGPDEFHTRDPGRDGPGVDNNAFTNVMASWVLHTALRALEGLSPQRRRELMERAGLVEEDLLRWDEIGRRLFVPFLGDTGVIAQFEGWDELEELDWEGLRERHGDIQRLDRILQAEEDDVNRYKATKQADVLMLFFLFSAEELEETFDRLGYEFDPESIPRTIEYYIARTSHGSTLSRIVHAWVLSRSDRPASWHLFRDALASDIDDIQGGTTSEGIHLGAMAGTVDLVQRCYAGIELRGDVLWLHPELPDQLERLAFPVLYRCRRLEVDIDHERFEVTFARGTGETVRIGLNGDVHEVGRGGTLTIERNVAGRPMIVRDLDFAGEGTDG
ncbi:MAG: glycosyl hydrolase family 65 protein [Gemmatimonadota bacterium]